ncbi:MAG: AAA family ATPase [Helicobacteraceae bacterium]|jgi:DNA sulfur modification protein DndD|nr:AAA family ATPase [Helicobacteraceae bacterium]
MLLKSLKLVNFRQYKGEKTVHFSCDGTQTVTIILGDNTYGKTTLLQSFNWCFYQTVLLPNPSFLLNYDVAASLPEGSSTEVEVEIILVHGGTEYVLTRTQEYIKRGGTVNPLNPQMRISYKEPDGQMQPIKENRHEHIINTILPKDLSSYFFFDTERVNSISTKRDLDDSVKGLLGLSILQNAIEHLGSQSRKKSVIGQFYGTMDLDGDARAKDSLNKIQDAQSRREAIAEQLENCVSEINHYDNRKEQVEAVLRDNQSTTVLQKKKEAIERQIAAEQTAQKRSIKALRSDFNAGSLHFFAEPLIAKASEFLKNAQIDDKGIKDLTKVTLLDIIKRGKCVCGAELSEGSQALEHVLAEIAYVPPESIGNTVRNYKERLAAFSSTNDRIFEGLTTRYEELYRSKARIQEWNDELEEISDKIKGKDSMEKFEKELIDIKGRLRDLNAKRERLIRDDEAKKQEIDRFQKIYDGLIAVSGKNKETMLYIRYAEEIASWLSASFKEKEQLIREELEERVNSIFEQMYHGHRRVSIDSKYQVSLLTTIDDKEIQTGESEGLNRVKNFAFIAGLVALAKDRIVADTGGHDIDLSSEPYPLVMDAPFSNADEIHTSNISRILPEVAEQVIMFVMQKDWRYAEPVMTGHVGKRYSLIKHSEQFSEIREAQ